MVPPEESAAPDAPVRITDLLRLMRPHQYVKNAFVFLPLFFGQKLMEPHLLPSVLLAFAAFCLLASAVYVFNDLQDLESDRRHPEKRNRPLASGAVSPAQAWRLLSLLAVAGLAAMAPLGGSLLAIAAVYLLLNLLYSLKLKHVAILDIHCIAVGFELRIFAGGLAAGVVPSHWLVLMTFLIALFLALAKRRDDLVLSQEKGAPIRASLDGYNFDFINAAMMVMASVTLVCYILYTLSAQVTAYYGSNQLYLTTLWVLAGFLRYLQVTLVDEKGSGSPAKLVLRDRFLQGVILLWLGSFFLLLYVAPH